MYLWCNCLSIVNKYFHYQDVDMLIHLSITFADVAKQVLDCCVVSNPETRDPKNIDFEVVLDYSFVEDHNERCTR